MAISISRNFFHSHFWLILSSFFRSRSRDRQRKRSRSRDRSPRGRRSSRSPGRGRSSGRRPRSLSRSPRRSPVGLTIGRDQFGRDKRRSSRSPPPSRKRSRSPQSRRDSATPPHKKVLKEYSSSKRKSDGGDLKGTNLDSWKKETVEGMFCVVKPCRFLVFSS